MPWDGISGLCKPTVHDRRLSEAISLLRGVSPEVIRHTAREVAAEGLAGRGALSAARNGLQNEKEARLLANFGLLLEVVRQIEPKGNNAIPPEQDRPAEVERRAKHAVALIAPSLRCSPEVVVERLEQLALIFASVGVGRTGARVPLTIANIARVRNEMMRFAEHSDDFGAEADLIANAADLTILMEKRRLPIPKHWLATYRRCCALGGRARCSGSATCEAGLAVGRLGSHSCALGRRTRGGRDACGNGRSRAGVPREADAWLSQRLGLIVDLPRYRSKLVQPMEDWRTGMTVCDAIARNKSFLEKTV